MSGHRPEFLLTLFVLLFAAVLQAQAPKPAGTTPKETETGFPVTDKATIAKCGGCHRADKDGNLSRISWMRTTPEGWQQAIKRMVRLNGLSITPVEGRQILRYLATNHGLAPEEAAPVQWYTEMRYQEAETLPNDNVRDACASCHPLARPESWRRSSAEWQELVNMHLGYFPTIEFTSFRRRAGGRGGRPAAGVNPPEPQRDPVDVALEHFRRAAPLHAKEWAAWRASLRDADLAGTWTVSASLPGKGKLFGTTEITATGPGEFTTKTKLVPVVGGSAQEFTGKVIVYTGYQWRGASKSGATQVREAMLVSRDQSTIEGRWFWGAYQEFGYQVKMRRMGADVSVAGTDVYAVKSGGAVKMRVFGANFPADVKAADVVLGAGITVKSVSRVSAGELSVAADVAAGAIAGPRDVVVRRIVAPAAFVVYDKVDYIRTATDSQLARLGGNTHPKGYVQFEAIGYHRGPDNKPRTADDIALGPVPVRWSVEEFYARQNDDDKDYVGTLNDRGLFTPASEGPNPKRRFSTDNFGDVWVVATFANPGGEPLVAKGYLVVTVPMYVRYDQPEVAE